MWDLNHIWTFHTSLHENPLLSLKYWENYKGNSSNFIAENSGRHHLNQLIKVNVISNNTYKHSVTPLWGPEKGTLTSVVSFPIMHTFNAIMREHQKYPNLGTFSKQLTSTLIKCPSYWKTELSQIGDQKTWQLNAVWDWELSPVTEKEP